MFKNLKSKKRLAYLSLALLILSCLVFSFNNCAKGRFDSKTSSSQIEQKPASIPIPAPGLSPTPTPGPTATPAPTPVPSPTPGTTPRSTPARIPEPNATLILIPGPTPLPRPSTAQQQVLRPTPTTYTCRPNYGATSLKTAVINGDIEGVRNLLAAGADPRSFSTINKVMRWADLLNIKALVKNTEILKLFLKSTCMDVNMSMDKKHNTILMFASGRSLFENLESVKVLLAAGADVNLQDQEYGYTALMWASKYGYIEIVKVLLAAGADLTIASRFTLFNIIKDETPLLLASQWGHTEIVKLLLAAGANVNRPNSRGETPLMGAVSGRLLKIISGVLTSTTNNRGHVDIVKLLLAAGANVNLQNIGGRTALMRACEMGLIGPVKILLAAGADFNIPYHGMTALERARMSEHTEVVRLLQAAGAR